jgi:transposase
LSDEQWQRVAPLLPGKVGDPGRSGEDNRRFLEAVLWIARTGSPWRDLPAGFGKWNSVFKRFRRWAVKGVLAAIFKTLSADPDFEYAIIDGTIVRVHQHGTGARGGLKLRPSAARAVV